MNWIRILNKVGLTSFRSDLSDESDLQFNVLHSPVVQFLNNVGLIVVPSEILPSNPSLRTLHRYFFVGSTVVFFALAIYIHLVFVTPSKPKASVPAAPPTAQAATGPIENQVSIATAQPSSHKKNRKKNRLGHQVSATQESIDATQNPGNLAPTMGRRAEVAANPAPIMTESVRVVGQRVKNLEQENYNIDIAVSSEKDVGDEALEAMLTSVAGVVDGSALSTVMKHGALIEFRISSTGSVEPDSIQIFVLLKNEPVEEIKKVLTNTMFAPPSANDDFDWDVSITSNNIHLVPDSQQ
jgi:hypothetical protein